MCTVWCWKDHSRLVDVIVEMLTPCANSRLKRKRIEKQTQTQTQCREEQEQEQHVNETDQRKNEVIATAPIHSPQDHNVRSRAIFILENASLKKGLVKKVTFNLIIPTLCFGFAIDCL